MELVKIVEKVRKAQKIYSTYTQEQVDYIFKESALAASNARIKLAKLACEETKMGIVEDKVIKNHFASEYIYNSYKDVKTCGVIEEDPVFGIQKIAEPIGVIAGIIPTTNPTSTAIFKALLALKTRNGIIFSPHPKAKKCTIVAAKIILEAAVQAGAPEDIISWIEEPSSAASSQLMHEADIILATGGPGLVKAAYSSGTPAIGVGAGNTPVIIDDSADVKMAISSILLSKTFDNGVICASEQSVIALPSVYKQVCAEFVARNAYILKDDELDKVRQIILKNNSVNPDIVGQSAYNIAKLAGVEVPVITPILLGEVDSVEPEEPFSHEKLSPLLALYKAKDFDDALNKADRLIEHGGMGHTSVLYADEVLAKQHIDAFGLRMKTGRILINMPSSQGAIGDIFNFKLPPSLTLGCGSWGGNAVSENVGVKQLINIKTVAERRENMLWFRIPEKVYFKSGSLPVALEELRNNKKIFIVTDETLANLRFTTHVTDILEKIHVDYRIYSDVQADPTLSSVEHGAEAMREYNPDIIIALGGGSAMDAAKIMWVLYEHPNTDFKDLAITFMDIRKRIVPFPKLGNKAKFWAIATTAGTGSEVTPFAVITDDATGIKYPLADYELTPSVAIVDTQLMLTMPTSLTVASGVDAVTHAVEAFASIMASEFTNAMALEALTIIFKYLPESIRNGSEAVYAKEKMAHASCMAGMAFANAFLGLCHSMAHKLGAFFHIPHGIANALLLDEVIRFNASDRPAKMAGFAQYKYPDAKARYARLAEHLNLCTGNETNDEKAKLFRKAFRELRAEIGIKPTIADYGVIESDFLSKLDEMVEQAFNDQCTGANPRYPLFEDIRTMYLRAYYGPEKYLQLQEEKTKN